MGVNFSVRPGQISARINIKGESVEQGELANPPLTLDVNTGNEFQVVFGNMREKPQKVKVI